MKTEVHYDLENDEAEQNAYADLQSWFGEKRLKEIEKDMAPIKNWYEFQMLLGIGGVEGFPVAVLYRRVHGEEPVEESK